MTRFPHWLSTLTLRQRLNGAILLTFVTIAMLSAAIMLPLRRHSLELAVDRAQVLLATLVARDREALANEIFEKQLRATRQRLLEMRKSNGIIGIHVYDAQGALQVSEGGGSPQAPKSSSGDGRGTLQQVRWKGQSTLRFEQPIELLGERIGFIEIFYSLADIEREQQVALLVMSGLLLTILVTMMGLLNSILSRAITRPIMALSQAIVELQAGGLGSQVPVRHDDEIGQLSRAFNRMSVELRDAMQNLEHANDVLEARIAERTAHLNDSMAQLQATQSQMIQQEKMASLGQLVASVAHEINTPIAAVKSSGSSAADALALALRDLPQIYAGLGAEELVDFDHLLASASRPPAMRSSREERVLVREMGARLAQHGIEDAAQLAPLLVQCHITQGEEALLPLLRHPERTLILQTAHNVALMVSNTANINVAVERVAKIVFALKSFSRFDQSGAMVEASLQEGLETVLTIYHNSIKHDVELRRHYAPLPPVPCLPDELNQVWTNLIHNSLQAMQHRGVLSVSTGAEDGYAVVSIADTGSGMAPELIDKIFDPFFTTKPRGEGSGLGLDIVRKIVDKHHGKIRVESALGKGSCFTILIPLSQPR